MCRTLAVQHQKYSIRKMMSLLATLIIIEPTGKQGRILFTPFFRPGNIFREHGGLMIKGDIVNIKIAVLIFFYLKLSYLTERTKNLLNSHCRMKIVPTVHGIVANLLLLRVIMKLILYITNQFIKLLYIINKIS